MNRIELEGMKKTLEILLTKHEKEFLNEKTFALAHKFQMNVESFDFFSARGMAGRATNEMKQAFEIYDEIVK